MIYLDEAYAKRGEEFSLKMADDIEEHLNADREHIT